MPEQEQNRVALLSAKGGATTRRVQAEIDSIWAELKDDPKGRQVATENGMPPNLFEKRQPAPFSAGQPEGQILETGAILVIIGTAALGWATKKALDILWDRWIWPKLQENFPDLEVKARYDC
jgi:hypothetical protein